MKKIIFKGCGTAIATPFTETGVNFEEFGKLIEYQIKNRVDSLIELSIKAYSIIEKFEDDERLEELWDLPEYLTQSDDDELSKIDEEY